MEEAPFGFGELEAGSAKLPVKRIEIHAKVSGVHAHVLLEQTYVNDRASLLEVTYVFPLPGLGAVSSYAFTIDGVTTRGTLHEREEARAIYDQAIAAGQTASTLEEDRPEVMTVRVGNLPPGSTAWVSIGMDLILPIADDCAVLRLPLLVGARYVPGAPLGGLASGDGTGLDTYEAPDASRVTPPTVDDPGIRVGVMIDAFGATDVIGTHPLAVERRRDRLHIEIADTLPDSDIVLQFPLAATDSALFCPDPTGDRGTLVVTACTALAPEELPLEVAVLLDRSGSMEGEKMTLARRAASWIVEGLTPRDRLLPIAFDHEVTAPLGNQLVQAFATQRRRATEWFGQVEAHGGTVIAAPLQLAAAAFDRGPVRDARRAIVLITDGQVANEDQLVAIAARSDVQILAVAIGPAANQGLCMRLARATGGGCEAAAQDAQLGAALDRVVRRLLAPVLEELDLTLEGAVIEPNTRTPVRPPRAIAGVPAVLAARTIGTPTTVVLHAIDPKGAPVRKTLPVETIDLPSLQRVWARSRLRDLEDRVASSVFPSGFPIEDELIATSLAYGVLCRYTAFAAVDPTVRDRALPRETLVQPVIAAERPAVDSKMMTRSGTVRGKLAYLSPEQVTAHPIGPASDVFTLAVIIQELAMLQRLFTGESDMENLVKILREPAPQVPLAYAPLQPILDRALAKDPAQRFADASGLAEAFARFPADRTGLAELAQQQYQAPSIPGPVKARSRAWWVTKKLSDGYDGTCYEATYAGPLVEPWPDAIVRVKAEYASEPLADPLAVSHPNIARIYGVLQVPDRAQVIEYVRGVDLMRLLHRLRSDHRPLTLGQVVAIAQDLTAALAAIHERGVAHRNLQPTKFVLSTAGRCILVAHAAAPSGTPLPVLPIPLRGIGALIP